MEEEIADIKSQILELQTQISRCDNEIERMIALMIECTETKLGELQKNLDYQRGKASQLRDEKNFLQQRLLIKEQIMVNRAGNCPQFVEIQGRYLKMFAEFQPRLNRS